MILAWLASNWRGVALAVLVAAIGAWILALRLQLDMTRHDLAAAQQEVAALSDRIKLQNAAVEKLKADGDARVKEATDGLAKTLRESQAARNEASRLRTLSKRLPTQPEPPRPAGCPPSGADKAVSEIRRGL